MTIHLVPRRITTQHIKCLLLQQPNIDINKGAEGWSPLALAGSHAEIIQLLKDAGAQQINNN